MSPTSTPLLPKENIAGKYSDTRDHNQDDDISHSGRALDGKNINGIADSCLGLVVD